jgi:hypothetical protein
LPAALGDRVNLGLDVLQRAHVPCANAEPTILPGERPEDAPPDPLDVLRRRVYQVVSGGRSAVSEVARGGMARDVATLERAHLTTAGLVLRGLSGTTTVGLSDGPQRERLARSWLVAWTYLTAANARIQRLSWTDT